MSREELDQQGLDPKPDSGSSRPRGEQNTPPASYTQNLGDYQLETLEVSDPEHPVAPQHISADFGKIYRGKLVPKQRVLLISLGITVGTILLISAVLTFMFKQNETTQTASSPIPVQDVTLDKTIEAGAGFTTEVPALLVNGDIITTGNFKVLSGGFATTLKIDKPTASQSISFPDASGIICLDSNNCGTANQADLTALSASVNARLANIVIPPSGVTELNGQDGGLVIQGTTNQITVSTAGGTLTLSTPQDLANISSPTFAGLVLNGNLNVTGIVDLPIDCSAQSNGGALTTNASGQIICSADDGAATGAVTTVGGTSGTIPVFSGAQTIIDSIITQAATTITVTGSLDVTSSASVASLTVTSLGNGPVRSTGGVISVGAINLGSTDVTGTLAVGNGGTGATTFTSNGLVYGNGSGALQVTSAGTGGQILIANVSGTPTFVTMSGDVNISNTGVSTIQLDSVALGGDTTGNYVSTITAGNGISGSSASEGATPTISLGTLTANWQQSGAFDIVLDNASAGLRILESTGASFYGIFDVGDLSANQTFTFTEGGVVVTSGNASSYATTAVGAGAGLIGGGTVGALSLDIGAGAGVTVNANDISVNYGSSANTAVQGNTSITLTAGTNLTGGGPLTLGAGGSVTFDVAASPIFTGTVTAQGGMVTIGTVSQQGELILHDGFGMTGTLELLPLPQATTYVFEDPGGATGTVCLLENENCVGSGTGVTAIQPSVAGRIAVFTGGQDITGSWLFQNGSTLELDATKNFSLLGGNLDVTGMGTFSSTLTANGNVQLGDAAGDTITYTGRVNSHILPSADVTYDLGSSANRWRDLYIAGSSIHIGTAGNEALITYNTGLSQLQIDQDVVITGTKQLSVPGQGASSEVFGAGAGAQGANALAVGNASTADGISSVALGSSASATGSSSVVIGASATDASNGQSIVIGRSAAATAPNQLVIGSGSTAVGQGYFGNGVTNASPQNFALNATGAIGTNIAGADLTLAGGRSTGSGSGGALIFQTSTAGAPGAGLNTLSEKARITAAGNFGIGDASPTALLTVGNGDLFQVNSSGVIAAAAGITSSGTINFTGGTVNLGSGTGSAGTLLLHDNDGVGSETISLTTPDVTASYVLTLPTAVGTTNQCLKASNNSGTLFWDNCSGGAGGGLSGSGTSGRIARFTPNGTTIADASLTDDGTNAIAVGDFTIQGGDLTLGTTTQTGSLIFNDNDGAGGETVTLSSGNVTASYSLALPTASGTNTQCIRVNGSGQLYFDGCSGGASGSGVGSLNTKTGDLVLQGTANQITVSSVDATTIGLSLPQNIHTGATPTFAGTTLTGQAFIDGGSDQIQLLVQGNATQTANLLTLEQSNGTDVLTVTNAGNTMVGGTLNVTGLSTLANVTMGTANILKTNNIEQTAAGQNVTIDALADKILFKANGKTFEFPTTGAATQEICTNGVTCVAGGGSAVLIAPGSAQNDGTTSATIQINKTGASGNLIEFTVSSAQRLTLDYNGGLSISGDITLATAKKIFTNNLTQTAAGQNVTIDALADKILFKANGKTFEFPTTGAATQEICTNGVTCVAGGGSAVLIAPGSAQNDGTTSATIQINKTGASGNLIEITTGAGFTQKFTVDYGGGLTLAGDLAVNGGDITSSGGLNITPGGALVVGATGQTATLQGSTLTLTSTGAGNDVSINSADTIELLDATNVTGAFTVSGDTDLAGGLMAGTGNAFQVAAATGNITTSGDLALNGGDLSTAGALNITTTGAGNDITIDAADLFIVQDDTLFNGSVTLGSTSANNITLNGIIQGANPFVFEGTSVDAFQLTVAVADPTADRTYTLPNSTAATDTFCLLTLGNCVGGAGGGAPNAAAYLTIGNDATLANERAITVNATNLTGNDGGANGNYTINTIQDIATTSSPQFTALVLTGDLAVNGGDITGTGALTLTPAAGANLNVALSGTGDFAVNTDDLYVDTSTGNVGVGTPAPSSLFSVGSTSQLQVNTSGSLTITQDVVGGGQTAFLLTPGNHTGVASEVTNFNVAGNTQTITAGISTQRFSLFGAPTITAAGAQGVTTAATVAIAGAPIQAGSASITNTYGLLIQSAAVGAVTNSYGLSVNAQTGATNNYAASFQGGNVGIGTSAPSATLQVSANSGTIPALSGNTVAVFSRNNTTANSAAISLISGTAATVTSGINFGTSADEDDGGFYYAPNEDTFSFRTGATSDRVVIQAGNVGIGDTTPAAALTVGSGDLFQVDSSGRTFMPAGTLGAGTLALSFTGDTNTGIYSSAGDTLNIAAGGVSQLAVGNGSIGVAATFNAVPGSVGAPIYSFSGSGNNTGIYSPTTDIVAFSSNGAESVRIDATGNVGIGTSTIGTNNRLIVNAYSFVDNLATAQINTNAGTNKGLVVQGFGSQSASLLELQDSAGNINTAFSSTGAQLTLGRVASSGTVTQGKLVFSDGTTDNFSTTIQTATMTVASRTLTIPNTAGAADIFCLATLGNCAGSGSGVTQSGANIAGQVSFFTSDNDITSNNLFMWDNTNTRLGVGIGAPTATLHVVGPTPAPAGAGNGTAAVAGATITGGTGGAATATTGVTAGVGGGVNIASGTGGAASGATGANTGGAGGAVAIGAGNGGAVSSSTATSGAGGAVTINSGSGGTAVSGGVNGTGGAITISAGAGGTGGTTGGNGGAVTIQGGTGGTSTNGNGGNITLQGGAKTGTGTEGSVIVKPQNNNGAAFLVQNAAGSSIIAVSTLTTGVTSNKLLIGNGTATLGAATSGGLFVTDSSEFLGQILIGTAANGVAVDATNHQVRFTGNARNDITAWLVPEFEGAVLLGDTTANVGTMVSNFCSGSSRMNTPSTGNPCAATEAHNFYEWATVETTAQDYDMYVRWKVPSDFDDAGMASVTFDAYGWRTNSTDELVQVSIFDDDDTTACGANTNVATGTATWTQTAVTVTSCDFDPNEFVTIKIHFVSGTNDLSRLGEMRFNYKSKF